MLKPPKYPGDTESKVNGKCGGGSGHIFDQDYQDTFWNPS